MERDLHRLQRVAIAPSQIRATQLYLTADQYHYLRRVLRLQAGDCFIAMDGGGQGWLAQVMAPEPVATLLQPMGAANELPVPISLWMALPKGNGMDDVVRQSTELGVHEILPLLSDRTLLQPSPQKLDRWRRIAREAAEQSERQVIPTILEPQSWQNALSQNSLDQGANYICEARQAAPLLLDVLTQQAPMLSPIRLATGPEGGWTEMEVEQAIAHQFQPVSLGSRILRAVTAPVAALALIAQVLEMQGNSTILHYP